MKLRILDPEAPNGFRRPAYGPVVDGKPMKSPAMYRLVWGLVNDAMRQAEQERREAEWVQQQMAAAPPLTALQRQGLRRVKRDLTRATQARVEEAARRAS
ncbi:hypothetical protein [Streptomyces sp. CO7]